MTKEVRMGDLFTQSLIGCCTLKKMILALNKHKAIHLIKM